jgi:hypothetical protein
LQRSCFWVSSVEYNDRQALKKSTQDVLATGYGTFDALHVSAAEAGKAEILLSPPMVDSIKRAARAVGPPSSGLEPCGIVTGAGSMTPVKRMTDEQFERYALEVLQRELGIASWFHDCNPPYSPTANGRCDSVKRR